LQTCCLVGRVDELDLPLKNLAGSAERIHVKVRRVQYLLLWLAFASYIAQSAAGAGLALCFGQSQHVTQQSQDEQVEQRECSHCPTTGALPIVPLNTDDETCPCSDIELRAELGRASTFEISIPPLVAVAILQLPSLTDSFLEPLRSCGFESNQRIGYWNHPDSARMRCVVLII
jgi:hypothetical protein